MTDASAARRGGFQKDAFQPLQLEKLFSGCNQCNQLAGKALVSRLLRVRQLQRSQGKALVFPLQPMQPALAGGTPFPFATSATGASPRLERLAQALRFEPSTRIPSSLFPRDYTGITQTPVSTSPNGEHQSTVKPHSIGLKALLFVGVWSHDPRDCKSPGLVLPRLPITSRAQFRAIPPSFGVEWLAIAMDAVSRLDCKDVASIQSMPMRADGKPIYENQFFEIPPNLPPSDR